MKRFHFLFLLLIICSVSFGQYNPSTHTGMNKPPAVTNMPDGARTYKWDAANFRWRPFISTAEVLTEFPTPGSRFGHAEIIINTGGTLSNGVITGGTNNAYWFKDGLTNSDLIQKGTGSVDVSGKLNVADTASMLTPYLQKKDTASLSTRLAEKQPLLESGVNIKTINGQPVVGPGDISVGGSGTTETGAEGASKDGNVIKIGNAIGQTSAQLTSDREIPLNTKSLQLTEGSAKFSFTKGLLSIRQDSTMNGGTSGGVFMRIDPIHPRPDALPFLFSRIATQQHAGATSPNEVVMWGHNLNGGGAAAISGQPFMGYSIESNFKPDLNSRWMESHEFFGTTAGQQVRLKSYTVNTNNNNIDFYKTVNTDYNKDISGNIWSRLALEPAYVTNSFAPLNSASYEWIYDNNGVQLTMSSPRPLLLDNGNQVNLPGAVFTPNAIDFTKETVVTGGMLKANSGLFVSGDFAHGVYPNETPFHVGTNATFNGSVKIKSIAGVGNRMVVADETGALTTQAIPDGGNGGGDVYQNGNNVFTGVNEFTNQVSLPSMLSTPTYNTFTTETNFENSTVKANAGLFVGGNFAHGVYPNETPFHVGSAATFNSSMKIKSFAGVGNRMVIADETGALTTQAIPAGGSNIEFDNTIALSNGKWGVDVSQLPLNFSLYSGPYIKGDNTEESPLDVDVPAVVADIPTASGSARGLLAAADYNRSFVRQAALSNPTGTINYDIALGGQANVNFTSTGGRTIAYSNLRSGDIVSWKINNTSGSPINLTLPAGSYLPSVGAATVVVVPPGRSMLTLNSFDGTELWYSLQSYNSLSAE